MTYIVFLLVANALALLATAYLVPGIQVGSFFSALLAALVLGLFNTFLRPIHDATAKFPFPDES